MCADIVSGVEFETQMKVAEMRMSRYAMLDGMRNEHIRWSLGETGKRKVRLDKPKNLILDMRAYVAS